MIIPSQSQPLDAVARHYDELDPFYLEIWGLMFIMAIGRTAPNLLKKLLKH